MFQISLKRLKNTPALRARGLHTRSRWSSVISKRNQTNTFELMAFFWHGNSASVRLQNPPKAFKTLQKPSKHLERDPTPDRFLQTAQISLKNTPALRARGLHTRSRWSFVIRDRLCRRSTMSSNVFKRARGKPSTQTCWFDFVPYHGASSAPCV